MKEKIENGTNAGYECKDKARFSTGTRSHIINLCSVSGQPSESSILIGSLVREPRA